MKSIRKGKEEAGHCETALGTGQVEQDHDDIVSNLPLELVLLSWSIWMRPTFSGVKGYDIVDPFETQNVIAHPNTLPSISLEAVALDIFVGKNNHYRSARGTRYRERGCPERQSDDLYSVAM